ncbi:MAG TPA: serpin family protein, partial [Polyangia bacterium]|nr:serpin family protein [Polyangia bacterium]
MKHRLSLALLLACSQSEAPKAPEPPQPPEVLYGSVKERDRSGRANGMDFTAVIGAENALTQKLFTALRAAEPGRNLAVSGYSVHQVLAMIYAGAAGTTAEEMRQALGWAMPAPQFHAAMNALDLELQSRAGDVTFTTANRLWAQRGLAVLPGFLDELTRSYGAPLAIADFAGAP